jgi:hypothetical protein
MRDSDSELESWVREQVRHSNAVDVDVVEMFRSLRAHVWLEEGESVASAEFARRVTAVCEAEVVDVPEAVEDSAVMEFERAEFESVDEALVTFIDCYTNYYFGPEGVELPDWVDPLVDLVTLAVRVLTLLEILARSLGLR